MARRGRGAGPAVTDRNDPGGGGLTGATGDLTPDEIDEAFLRERREMEDPDGRARATEGAASGPRPSMTTSATRPRSAPDRGRQAAVRRAVLRRVADRFFDDPLSSPRRRSPATPP